MNIELVKQLADLRNQFNELKKQFIEDGSAYGIRIEGELQVKASALVGKENLEIEIRDIESEYPYRIFHFVEGIKVFAIAQVRDLEKFPQFKNTRKEHLLKELAELEKEEEATWASILI